MRSISRWLVAALLVVVVVGGLGSMGCARPQPSPEGPELTLASGWKMYHIDQGPKDAPVILFVHGLGGSSEYWVQAMACTEMQKYRCLAIDLLGFGGSDKPEDFDYSMEKQAETIREFLALKKVDKVIYVGHSMGGSVGMALLQLQPDLVEKLVLLDTTLDPSYMAPVFQQISGMEEAQFGVLFQGLKMRAKETTADFFQAPSPETLEMSARVMKQSTSYSFLRSLKGIGLFLEKQQAVEVFKNLEIPHYYIFGTTDEGVARMVNDHFGSEPWVHPIENVKHCAMVEDPASFCSVLGKILAQ